MYVRLHIKRLNKSQSTEKIRRKLYIQSEQNFLNVLSFQIYSQSCILLFLSIWWSGSWGFPHVSRTVKKLEKLDDQGDKLSTSVFNSTDQLIRTTLSKLLSNTEVD